MTECLSIDPWRKSIKELQHDCLLRECCEVITDHLSLEETNRLLLQEGRRQSLAQREFRQQSGRYWLDNLPTPQPLVWRARRRVRFQEGGSTSSGARWYQ